MTPTNSNTATITGWLVGQPTEDHTILGETFYTSSIQSARTSGTLDTIRVTIPGRLLATLNPKTLAWQVTIHGQVRSYNKIIDGAGHLEIVLFAQSIVPAAGDPTQNSVSLEGALCRPPIYRFTPFGREICDVMLAVNRAFGKSDYIPCIVWGRNGKWASGLKVGDSVRVNGRLQSRQYEKVLENGERETRTAYELSVFSIEHAMKEESVMA